MVASTGASPSVIPVSSRRAQAESIPRGAARSRVPYAIQLNPSACPSGGGSGRCMLKRSRALLDKPPGRISSSGIVLSSKRRGKARRRSANSSRLASTP